MPRTKQTARVLQLKIELDDSSPLVWRRFLVREDITLLELHFTIQSVMGWWNSHLHRFEIEKKGYWNSGENEYDDFQDADVATTILRDALKATTKTFRYEYDFGDGWCHTVKIEKRFAPDSSMGMVPRCLAGENACPPEDVGGLPGFEDFKDAMTKPGTEEFIEHLQWHGGEFLPTSFCPNLVNRELRHLTMFEWRVKPRVRQGSMIQADPYRGKI
jgi:Plasmid pRiA4b ORF-3-like protein